MTEQELKLLAQARLRLQNTPLGQAKTYAQTYGGPYLTGLGQSVAGLASMVGNPGGAGMSAVLPNYNPQASLQTTAEQATGPWPEPQKGNIGQEFAKKLGQYTPAIAGGNPLDVLLPAAGAEAGKVYGRGTKSEPWLEAAGGLAGGLLSSGIQAMGRTPIPANRQGAVDTLTQEGIEPTSGQMTGNRELSVREAQRGGDAYTIALQKQQEQLTAAAARKAGLNAGKLTPDVVDNYLTDIGSKFDEMAAASTGNFTKNDWIKANEIATNYKNSVEGTAAPIVDKIAQSFGSEGPKTINGDTYQGIRWQIDKQLRGSGSPQMKEALYGLRGLLDDVVERGLDPSLNGAWKELRRQYRDWIVVEKAVDPTTGYVTPSSLQRAAVANAGKRGYLRGKSDFTDLANAADTILTRPPSSGTAENLAAKLGQVAAPVARAVTGGSAGYAFGGPIGAAIGSGVTTLYPYISDKLMMSPSWQAFLRNQEPFSWVPPWLQSGPFQTGRNR